MPKICPVCGVTYPDANVFCATDGTTLRAADADGDLIGSVIADRYLVTDLLGEGGMGKVYLARHVRLPQQAAIKVLRPDQVRDASAIARFNSEAANASRIDHDRVARVYDFGETGEGIVYLAMEFVAGRTLKALLAAGGPVPPRRAAALVRQIADGLDAAHRMGIVHRDLKPDNVLVIEGEGHDGSDDRVKVVDFGIAKAFGADATGSGLTRTGFVVGTPEYMSPEQLLGAQVDARSDVYALALVAYNLLTGDLPFDLNTPDRGLTARLTQDPRPLAAVQPTIPWSTELQGVFSRGLSRLPDDRPASAGAFARELSAAVEAWEARPLVDPHVVAASGALSATPPIALTAVPAPTNRHAPAPSAPTAPAPLAPAPSFSPPSVPPQAPARGRGALIGAGVGLAAILGISAVVFARRGTVPVTSATISAAPATSAGTSATPASSGATNATSAPVETPLASAPTGAAAAGSAPPVNQRAAAAPAGVPRTAPSRTASGTPAAGSVGPAATTPPAVVVRPTAGNARHTLDSIAATLDPSTADAGAGRAAFAPLRALLPRLTTAEDSTSAFIRLIEASLLANDQGRACTALRAAHAVVRAGGQRDALKNYDGMLSCP